MGPEIYRIEDLVKMNKPSNVIEEVQKIVHLIYPHFDFNQIYRVFEDILKLFHGEYPNFRRCNTRYHDLKHTTDCLMAMARLIHGASVEGVNFQERDLTMGLIAALMHDTGYIQTIDDKSGTGAKYTLIHISRSIDFSKKYFADNGFSTHDFEFCRNCLNCTGLDVKIRDILFESPEQEMLGKMLGTSDLLGQLAGRTYLEKLSFLFQEFQEGGFFDYEDEFELLKKTYEFWEFTKKRLAAEFNHMDRFMIPHFRVRWGINRNLYIEAIERNINCLKGIMDNHPADYQKYLKRGSLLVNGEQNESP
jgi:hypothetical protein